jgi:predicted transcriptional regulator
MDEPIWLRLKDNILSTYRRTELANEATEEDFVLGSTPSAVEQAVEQSQSAPYSVEENTTVDANNLDTSDPTFRIGRLPAANKPLVTVNQNDELSRAVTLMMQYDFSQLPVMQGEREVKGVITWKSIGLRKTFGSKSDRVCDCQERATIVDADRTLFESIPLIMCVGLDKH